MPLGHLDVRGAQISYRRSGPRDRPPIVLVHGRAGHIGWWFGVAPALARHRDVVVVDLSGHGDSGHRSTYDPSTWADEVAAVVADLGAGPAVIVGHSMGGHIAAHLASRSPEHVRMVLLIDSRLGREPYRAPAHDVVKYYATKEEGLAQFRLRPRGTTAPPELLGAVASYGLVETPLGWRWKFDPRSGQPFGAQDIEHAIAGIRCPVGVVYGELSELADDTSADYVAATIGRPVPRIGVPGAHHHVPLDRAEACRSAITLLIGQLEPAVPGHSPLGRS